MLVLLNFPQVIDLSSFEMDCSGLSFGSCSHIPRHALFRFDTPGRPVYVCSMVQRGGVQHLYSHQGGHVLHSPQGWGSCSTNFDQGRRRTHSVSALLLVFRFLVATGSLSFVNNSGGDPRGSTVAMAVCDWGVRVNAWSV